MIDVTYNPLAFSPKTIMFGASEPEDLTYQPGFYQPTAWSETQPAVASKTAGPEQAAIQPAPEPSTSLVSMPKAISSKYPGFLSGTIKMPVLGNVFIGTLLIVAVVGVIVYKKNLVGKLKAKLKK